MNLVASLFLRAKHWQLFLLFLSVILLQVFSIAKPFSDSPEELWRFSVLDGVVMALQVFFYVGWLWSMGSFLNSIVKAELRPRMGFFRFSSIYTALYVFFFMASFESNELVLWAVIIPLHLLEMFCILYLLFFVSKSLVLGERAKPVSFYDHAGPLFLLWLFPFGVWHIQPRVNRLCAMAQESASNGT